MDWDYHSMTLAAQQGWQCPVCGKVNAPWMAQCTCDGKVPYHTTATGTGKTLEYGIDYGRPPYTKETTTGTPLQPQGYTTSATYTLNEDDCESCLGGCDLCYYCKNGDHFTHKGWSTKKEKK